MHDRNASHTALATAYMRAAHQLLDAQPRILDDPLALGLLGSAAAEQIRQAADLYQTETARAVRSHVVLRARFAEDRLAAAVRRGVRQYIILGAGFDTFALRQPSWAREISIIEVDHAGTQNVKRAQLDVAGLPAPSNTCFATLDFERESLQAGLSRYQVSLEQPSFFSWLGVTMYLHEPAIDAVLRSVATFPAGSEIVLTFAPSAEEDVSFAGRAAALGEPWLSYFEPGEIESKLRASGFKAVEFLTPDAANAHYFQQRADLPAPARSSIVSART